MYPQYKQIVLGDFNSTIGKDAENLGQRCLGKNIDNLPTNENGNMLLSFSENNNLTILNSIYRTKTIHRITFVAPTYKKRLDYILGDKDVRRYSSHCRVYRDKSKTCAIFDTDHRLLVLNLKIPFKREEKRQKIAIREKKEKKAPKQYDISALKSSEKIRISYSERVNQTLKESLNKQNPSNKHDINDLNRLVVDAIKMQLKILFQFYLEMKNLNHGTIQNISRCFQNYEQRKKGI